MRDFKVGEKVYILDEKLRSQVKAGWQEMLNPAKKRVINPNLFQFVNAVVLAESLLAKHNETLVDKNILEVGCNEGARAYLMAKYQDTWVHGIDVDEYTVDQSPDLNAWNPKDVEFVHGKFDEMRKELSNKLPNSVVCKVTFETSSIEQFKISDVYDVVISWDTIEHILDLPTAFKQMASSLKVGGISYHDYNPFFALNGGHSLCTLDFLYGHCRLSNEDFKRYISEYRPDEEKIDINFYEKCLNRATRADIRKYATEAGFEILQFDGVITVDRNNIETGVLEEVQRNYPTATIEDLLCHNLQLILRKK